MLRQYVLLRNAIHAKYKVSSKNQVESKPEVLESSDEKAILYLNNRLAFELSDQTHIAVPSSMKNTKKNFDFLSECLEQKNYQAALDYVKINFDEIQGEKIVNLALHHNSYEFIKLFLRESSFYQILSPNSLRRIATQFSNRSLIISMTLCESFAKKIGYDYLATLSILNSNSELAYRLMTTPKLISRLSTNKIYDLALAYPRNLRRLLENLCDPALKENNPARDMRWVVEMIDTLYFEYDTVRAAVHQREEYILYMLELGSRIISKERLIAMRLTEPVLGNIIATSEPLKRALGLVEECSIEFPAPTFISDYPRRISPDRFLTEVDQLERSLSELNINESNSLNQDKLIRSRTCASYCRLL